MLHIYRPRIGGHWDVEDANISDGDVLADEVEINLNMCIHVERDWWRGRPY
jgi:hypothetical protein